MNRKTVPVACAPAVIAVAATALFVTAATGAEALTPAAVQVERKSCLAVKDASKRAACLDALLTDVLLGWSDEIGRAAAISAAAAQASASARTQAVAAEDERSKAQLQALMKPFLALQAARESGVSLNAYRPLVLSASTEVAQARAGVYGKRGEAAAPALVEAVEAFSDAAAWWQADIEFFARRDNRLAYPGGLPIGLAHVEAMVNRYSIPTGKADIWGLNRGAPLQSSLAAIWQAGDLAIARAKERLEAAPVATIQSVPDVPIPARATSDMLPNGCPPAAPNCSWGKPPM